MRDPTIPDASSLLCRPCLSEPPSSSIRIEQTGGRDRYDGVLLKGAATGRRLLFSFEYRHGACNHTPSLHYPAALACAWARGRQRDHRRGRARRRGPAARTYASLVRQRRGGWAGTAAHRGQSIPTGVISRRYIESVSIVRTGGPIVSSSRQGESIWLIRTHRQRV